MRYFLINKEDGKSIVGSSGFSTVTGFNTIPIPDGCRADKPQWYLYENRKVVLNNSVAIPEVQAERIQKIKNEANDRISLLDWRLARAKERFTLGIANEETIEYVMGLREQIRIDSNRAEEEVKKLKNIQDITLFSW